MAHLIAITGGIGSGKSVVSSILRVCGYKVYDCDLNAKLLMDNSNEIKRVISKRIDSSVITPQGDINRTLLSSIVFGEQSKLQILNKIVHGAVRADIIKWRDANEGYPYLFVETAILYQSGLDAIVDEVWDVTAPQEVRIERVMRRNNFSREQVEARINSQNYNPQNIHPDTKTIVNDDVSPLLPQILTLLLPNGLF